MYMYNLMQRLYFEMRVRLINMFHFTWYVNYFLSFLEKLSSEHRPIGAGTSEKLARYNFQKWGGQCGSVYDGYRSG